MSETNPNVRETVTREEANLQRPIRTGDPEITPCSDEETDSQVAEPSVEIGLTHEDNSAPSEGKTLEETNQAREDEVDNVVRITKIDPHTFRAGVGSSAIEVEAQPLFHVRKRNLEHQIDWRNRQRGFQRSPRHSQTQQSPSQPEQSPSEDDEGHLELAQRYLQLAEEELKLDKEESDDGNNSKSNMSSSSKPGWGKPVCYIPYYATRCVKPWDIRAMFPTLVAQDEKAKYGDSYLDEASNTEPKVINPFDDRTLAERELDRSESDRLSPLDKYFIYPPAGKYPFPRVEWDKYLRSDVIKQLEATEETLVGDDVRLHEALKKRLERRKKRRLEEFQKTDFSPKEVQYCYDTLKNRTDKDCLYGSETVVDSFGITRCANHYNYALGLNKGVKDGDLPIQEILFQRPKTKEELEPKDIDKYLFYGHWISEWTEEEWSKIVAPFDPVKMREGAKLIRKVRIQEMNKRRKTNPTPTLWGMQKITPRSGSGQNTVPGNWPQTFSPQPKKGEPTGFRATKWYKAIRATVRFIFSTNS